MIQKSYKNLTLAALIFAIGFSPMLTYAKGNSENKGKNKEKSEYRVAKVEKKEIKEKKDKSDDDNDDRKEPKSNNGKAYGHLIAPGYIKNWGQKDYSWYSFLPFGIKKKFFGMGTTTATTTDTVAPVISSISSKVGTTTATISWKTNEKSDSIVYFSTSSPVVIGGANTSSKSQTYLAKYHEVELNNLLASTTYYIVVSSKDKAGNTATSSQFNFTTKGSTVVTDAQAPVVSNVVTTVASSTINVAWNTNEPATTKMYYSTTSPLVTTASTTSFVLLGNLVTNHSITATGLATSTAYHIVIESIDAVGNTTQSPQFTATTTSGI